MLFYLKSFVFKEKLHFLLAVVEKADAEVLKRSIASLIEGEFYTVHTFKKADNIISENRIDVIICDLQLKDGDAIDFICALKEAGKKQYTIIISGDRSAYIQDEAYKSGANDYLLKTETNTIGFKIKNLFSNLYSNQTLKGILIDEEKYAVIKNNQSYFLPAKEFEIVKLFCSSPQKIFSREEIANHIWKDALVAKSRIIDVHITHIRKIIGKETIRSIKKVGYGLIAS